MNKILVTGANGQLGSELQELASTYTALQFVFTDVEDLDITNREATEEAIKKHLPDYVINCAAYTAVDQAESDQEKAYCLNVSAVINLSDLCDQYGLRLIHISTDYVFSGTAHRPYGEDDVTNPASVYGQSKLEGEQVILETEIEAMIIRTSWLYSTFGHNFVKTMLRLGREREELKVVFDQIGTPTYARDLAKFILDIISTGGFKTDIFHYSNEGVCSWYDFALSIMDIKGIDCRIKPIETKDYPTPAPRPFYSLLNKQKVKASFGSDIPYWRDSLRTCLSKL